mgnify:CR=1 FL=1
MAWYSEQHHSESFSNIEYDRCIFCGGDRTVIAKKNFKIVFARLAITLTLPSNILVKYSKNILQKFYQKIIKKFRRKLTRYISYGHPAAGN